LPITFAGTKFGEDSLWAVSPKDVPHAGSDEISREIAAFGADHVGKLFAALGLRCVTR
jgi:hypothetical protein